MGRRRVGKRMMCSDFPRAGPGRRLSAGAKIDKCRVLRDVIPPTPPGPEGSNGNGLVRAQWVTRRFFGAVGALAVRAAQPQGEMH